MGNILNKEEILLLKQLNETNVPWNKSALGILSNAALRPFSWLSGNIKKGIKKQQINNLIQQYGLEIVSAIHKIDTGELINPKTKDKEDSKDSKDNSTDQYTSKNPNDSLNTFKNELNALKKIKPLITKFLELDNLDLKTTQFATIKKTVKTILEFVKIDELLNFLNKYEIPGTEDYEIIIKNFKSYSESLLNAETVMQFAGKQAISKSIELFKIYEKNLSDLEDLYDLTILELNEQLNGDKEEDKKIDEANSYKLPKDVTSLFSEETLRKIEEIPKIKDLMEIEINKVRLNTIAYEANYIIDTSEKEKNKLDRLWTIGINNIKDYFQKIIDPNILPLTSTTSISDKVKNRIENDQKTLSELQKLDITKTFPVGEEFEKAKLYAFECIITGQNGKNLRTILLTSPVSSFEESITDNEFRYFKIFGGYKFDKSIERVNIFNHLTNNSKMINDFEKDTSFYYMAVQNIKPSSKSSPFFLYSGDGKMFFNNKIDDVNVLDKTLKEYKGKDLSSSINNMSKFGNTMKILINQRFEVEDKNIINKKYPNISMESVISDANSRRAINNHKKLINILS